MKKFIPLIADALLAGVCVFLLFFTLVRYYFSTAAGLAAGITAGLAAGAGTFFYIRAKQKKTLELSACKAGAEKLAVHLALTGNREAAALIAACTGGKPAGSFAESDDKLFYACFTPEPATRNELIPLIRVESAKQKVFACCTATPASNSLCACASQASISLCGLSRGTSMTSANHFWFVGWRSTAYPGSSGHGYSGSIPKYSRTWAKNSVRFMAVPSFLRFDIGYIDDAYCAGEMVWLHRQAMHEMT